ncbi:acyl-CoA reductase-like NAD-dependent aldehyde dehydrogenase [Thermocatellispora tengchongensis]|uniref:Acyl-CoA reductase-like NAD-dependent aldehyde dehydrogenase n=1 Tax=Thermocatellispora tengchongensis TaxID=1073253 RepID=A0A840PMW5_9ACTN|nr:aldehyde dehydrogenase family protein [Thermocatellispora tengchongensis]MBB5137385.1 acyl-CoA reductase-like NAD-dependent aldehyde dehydrogenase [Thermocatellispora tengchongensis]
MTPDPMLAAAAALLIGDERITDASGGAYEHVFPGTGTVNATIPLAGAEEIDAAVRSASAAQREWAALSPGRRHDLLRALARAVEADAETLARLNVHDYAVPIAMSPGQGAMLVRFLDYYAGWVDKATGEIAPVAGSHDINMIQREPYGVVGVIVPWNGPLVGIAMAVAPALAAGNAVVIKPPELAPLAPVRFGELCRTAGLPAGLVNVVPGGPAAGEALVRHPGVGKIHFTGSGATARKIAVAAADGLKPLSFELGGKSANIVFADADLDRAAGIAAFMGPLTQSGQSCACGSRILVERSIYPEFQERLVHAVRNASIGDPFDPSTQMGPVISQSAADRILGVIKEAVSQGTGRLITGGNRVGGPLADGYFIEPTVFADVPNDSPLARIETFGPVVSVMPFDTEDEAVAIANDTEYGLVAYAHTSDFARAHRMVRRLQAGSVWINTFSDIQPSGPYGGYKRSGYGRLGGIEGLHEFTQVKNARITFDG